MKNHLILCLFILGLSSANAQKPSFKTLKDGKFHAGCFIYGDKNQEHAIANLSEYDSLGNDVGIFNFKGTDLLLKRAKGTAKYPELYQNKDYKVYVREQLMSHEPPSCLYYNRYYLKVIYKKQTYYYIFKGFCGC